MDLYVYKKMAQNSIYNKGWAVDRKSGTPQGGVISPVLANMFLHYVFDMLDLCQYFGHKKLNFSPSITYAERIIS